MNNSQGQYIITSQLFELCRATMEIGEAMERGVVDCLGEITMYNVNTEAIVGSKCDNV